MRLLENIFFWKHSELNSFQNMCIKNASPFTECSLTAGRPSLPMTGSDGGRMLSDLVCAGPQGLEFSLS